MAKSTSKTSRKVSKKTSASRGPVEPRSDMRSAAEAAEKQLCIYLTQIAHGDVLVDGTDVVYETLVAPTMYQFPEFTVNTIGYVHETGAIDSEILIDLSTPDLVIADLTGLSSSGYFLLGMRHSSALPTVYISNAEFVTAVNASQFKLFRYDLEGSPLVAGDEHAVNQLAEVIRDALNDRPSVAGGSRVPLKGTGKAQRSELAKRIDETAEIIALLRINSTGDAISELHAIANELRAAEDEKTSSALKDATSAALMVVVEILDQLSSVRGARMAISGAIALVVGGAGWPAVTALALACAYWEGKDAFLRALKSLPAKKKG
jgi:hypothetical protein